MGAEDRPGASRHGMPLAKQISIYLNTKLAGADDGPTKVESGLRKRQRSDECMPHRVKRRT